MKKIPTLFERDPEDRSKLIDKLHPDCEWVQAGEGVATRKYDGTCVRLDHKGRWWSRREVKPGKQPPPEWQEVDHDPVTGKRVGWEPIEQSSFFKAFNEAVRPMLEFSALASVEPKPGTYELIGPKINGNPEKIGPYHSLQPHGNAERLAWADDRPNVSFFESMRDMVLYFAEDGIEGVVWHHPDGRMAKLKGRDFK